MTLKTYNSGWRPTSLARDEERDTSTLAFGANAAGTFYVRGAIAWPREVGGGRFEGFAIVGGVKIPTVFPQGERLPSEFASQPVTILDELAYVTLQHVMEDGKIITHGLGPWLVRSWAEYGCRKFFERDGMDVLARQHRAVRESENIQPTPRFLDAEWTDTKLAAQIITEKLMSKQLVFKAGSVVDEMVSRYSNDAVSVDLEREPVLYCVMLLLHGFAQRPWSGRPRIERDGL